MDNPKRARSEKPRKQPRECAYVRSPDLQSALERIRQVACRDKGAMAKVGHTGAFQLLCGAS